LRETHACHCLLLLLLLHHHLLLLPLLHSHVLLLLLLLLLHCRTIHCPKSLHVITPSPRKHTRSSTRLLSNQLPQLLVTHLVEHCFDLRGRPPLLYGLLQQQRVAAQLQLLLRGQAAS
jgi:hypothetical protein